MKNRVAFLAALCLAASLPFPSAGAPASGAVPPSRAEAKTAADMPPVLGDLAQYFAPPPAYRAAAGRDRLAVALGLFPPLQTGGPDTDVTLLRLGFVSCHHNVSGIDVPLFFGRSRGAARGIAFSGFNLAEGPARGIQVGIVANVAGTAPESESAGVQLAAGANWADSFSGVQFAGMFNRSSSGRIAQIAALCNSSDDFKGVQFGAVNLRGRAFSGVQAGLLNGGADSFSGLQFGIFANSAVPLGNAEHHAKMDGWQVAILVNAADSIDGGQVSLVNLAADVKGIQIGVYNQARRIEGVQIGLLNHCDASSVPFLPFLRAAF